MWQNKGGSKVNILCTDILCRPSINKKKRFHYWVAWLLSHVKALIRKLIYLRKSGLGASNSLTTFSVFGSGLLLIES